ncbi:oligomeric complex COG6-domain-containing protein [Mycena leptocephala]|nr:oligomeric complex COG6-domain-containing protein [Mycena leptocephala]
MSSPVVSPSSSALQFDRKARAPQSRNPVSLRLYKVLGTNFDDDPTREALQTLSELYATSASTVKGKETLQNVEEDELEEELVKPGGGVAEELLTEAIPGESAARARKNLRRDMEKKLAEGSHQFLKAFGEVDQKLEELQHHVASMHASCDEAETQLRLTNESSAMLLERAGSLSEERQEVENKKSIVTLFLNRFTLNEEEVEAMTSRDIPVGQRFFQAMDKTERIRTDCRVLMAGEDGPTQAGLDIMASTSSHLEQGYEKIFRWCSYEFRQMGRDMQIEVGETLREAVRRLRKRPELLTEALTALSQARQATLMSSFLTALTRGGPSGLPRPIELHAHDPMRYVGDMLAWVHQAIAAEREFLESLFGLQADGRMVGSVRVFREKSEEEDWIRELMDLAVGKLCAPSRHAVRVQQTIRSQESSIISYKIANLLQFYMITMRRTIGEAAVLSTTLNEITEVSYKVFYDAIETQGRALLRATLGVMNVYESSLLGDEGEAEQTAGFQRILDVTVDPAIEFCTSNSEEKNRLRPRWDREVYVLNCLSYLQYKNIMVDAGIDQIAETCVNHDESEPMSRIPAALPAQLQTALHNFSLWLSGLEVQVKKPENKYEAASTLLGSERPFGQVNLLWQIFGLEEDSIKDS